MDWIKSGVKLKKLCKAVCTVYSFNTQVRISEMLILELFLYYNVKRGVKIVSNRAKISNSLKNGRFPVGVRVWVQETFLCVFRSYISVPNSVHLRQS